MRKMFMLLFKDLINEHLSQKISVLYPMVLTVHSILAAVNRIDLSGTPCRISVIKIKLSHLMQYGLLYFVVVDIRKAIGLFAAHFFHFSPI